MVKLIIADVSQCFSYNLQQFPNVVAVVVLLVVIVVLRHFLVVVVVILLVIVVVVVILLLVVIGVGVGFVFVTEEAGGILVLKCVLTFLQFLKFIIKYKYKTVKFGNIAHHSKRWGNIQFLLKRAS